jgi:hypothetical protein
MGTAPKELATVMRSMEGAIAMGDEAVVRVELPSWKRIMKVTVMVVERRMKSRKKENRRSIDWPPPPGAGETQPHPNNRP